MVELCDTLDAAPAWYVRPGSVVCPMRDLRQTRLAAGRSWPIANETELLHSLGVLAASQDASWRALIGVAIDPEGAARIGWISASLRSNTLMNGAPQEMLADASWFEGVSHANNAAAAAAGSTLRGWQTSAAWVWMEALDEAVGGTVGCIVSGALFTIATLVLFTGSLRLAAATIGGVLCVLVCFLGYLAQRGYALGVIEAIATTIFIGFSCDYCVHTLQVHRTSGGSLLQTLALTGPSLYSAGLTTAGAAAPLLMCEVIVFRQLGEFVLVCTILSLAVALGLFAPLLSLSLPPLPCALDERGANREHNTRGLTTSTIDPVSVNVELQSAAAGNGVTTTPL